MHIKNKTYCVNDIYKLDSISQTGRGCCAVIMDTGIYPHTDLADHIIYFKDFVNQRLSAYDDNSHGTHVAGIIAGNGYSSQSIIKGMAPDCKIIALKILDKKGSGDKDSLLDACDWVKHNRHKYGIKIVNKATRCAPFLHSRASAPTTSRAARKSSTFPSVPTRPTATRRRMRLHRQSTCSGHSDLHL